MDDGLVEWIATGGRTEARRDVGCAGVPGMHGGNEVHDLLPMRTDALKVNARSTDLLDVRRDRRASWQDLRAAGFMGNGFLSSTSGWK